MASKHGPLNHSFKFFFATLPTELLSFGVGVYYEDTNSECNIMKRNKKKEREKTDRKKRQKKKEGKEK
jgi:hypothetical protein